MLYKQRKTNNKHKTTKPTHKQTIN